MGLRRRYRRKTDASRRYSSYSTASNERLDEIGMTEAVRAAVTAVTALADTLNALGLRIALAKEAHSTPEDTYPSYHNRLALLAESASGQVQGIQKLLRAIELTTLRREAEQINKTIR
jgi:hypothetical protein